MSQELQSIIDGEELAPEPVEAQAEEQPPEVAAEPAEVEPEVEPEKVEEQPAAMVPLAALQEVRQELRSLKEMQQAQSRPEVPVPDVFSDPEGFKTHVAQTATQQVTQAKLELSRFMAEQQHGKETVDAAFEYFNTHPEQSQALMQSPSPFHAAVDFYQSQQLAQEIGSDPKAYREKVEAEVRAKLEAEMVARQAQAKAALAAPSLAGVTGATGGGPQTNWNGPTALEDAIR